MEGLATIPRPAGRRRSSESLMAWQKQASSLYIIYSLVRVIYEVA